MRRHIRLLFASVALAAFFVALSFSQGNRLPGAEFHPLGSHMQKVQVNSPNLERIPLVNGQAFLVSQPPPKEVALALADQTRPERINKLESFEARKLSSSLLHFENHGIGKKIPDSPTAGALLLFKNTQKR